MQESRLALDVMGGDHAPAAILEGAMMACDPLGSQRIAAERVLLVGDQAVIEAYFAERGGNPGFPVLHASQAIGMDEKPAQALRAKPDNSISRAVQAVREGQAGAAVSMGNTGAMVGAATLILGTLAGVKRPGISVTLELGGTPITLLDMGANVAPKAQHLLHYAVMGSVYVRNCLGKKEPRVALLNIGEEPSKGTDLVREAHGLLERSRLSFIGNLEPSELFSGKADIVVTDGFTGNAMLKLMEGLASYLLGLVLGELKAHKVPWGNEVLAKVKRGADYSEYGGALLLGVDGVVVIGHGRSRARAVANALSLGARTIDARVCADIVTGVEAETGANSDAG